MTCTRWPASVKSRATGWDQAVTPPVSSMLWEAKKMSRALMCHPLYVRG